MEFYTAQEYIDAHFKPGQDHTKEYPRLYAEWKAYKVVMQRQLQKADRILRAAGVPPKTPQAEVHPGEKNQWWSIRHRLYTAQLGKCFWCVRELGEHWQVDHHIPRALGGSKGFTNLRALCISCNQRKGRLMPEEFAIIMCQDLL